MPDRIYTMTLIGKPGGTSMFERYTDRARRVLVLAQEEAHTQNHDEIGTEHLLIGFVAEGGGVAFRALSALGVTLDMARESALSHRPIGRIRRDGHLPFTRPARKVFEYALREALELGHNYIATEHLLLGLVRLSKHEPDDAGVLALAGLGIADGDRGFAADVREKVLELLHGYARQERTQPAGPDRSPAVRLIEERNHVIRAVLAILDGQASARIDATWAGSPAAERAYGELSAAASGLSDAQAAWDEHCADSSANRAGP